MHYDVVLAAREVAKYGCMCLYSSYFFSEDNTVSFRLCAPLDYLGRAFGLRNPLPAFAVKVFTV